MILQSVLALLSDLLGFLHRRIREGSWNGPLLLLVVLLATAAVHAPSLGGGFHYDDEAVILLNRENLRDPGTVARFLEDPDVFSGVPNNGMFRPVTHASAVLDAVRCDWPEDGAPDPFPWHVTNLLLHVLSAGAVFLLARRILRTWWGGEAPLGERAPDAASLAALLGALWFGLQPVNSEVVNYVSSRSESLAALFFLLALWMHHAAWDGERPAGRRALLVAGSVAAALLSFGSKETGALLPAVAGALELWARPGEGASPGRRFGRGVLRALPLGAALGAYLLLRRHAMEVAVLDLAARPEMTGAEVDPLMGAGRTMAVHLLTQARVIAAYALLLLFPVDLSPDHGVRVAAALDGPTVLALLGIAGGTALVVRAAARGGRAAPLVAAWAACALAPSVLVPLNVVMNEHRLYLPTTGLALGAGVLLLRGWEAARRLGEGKPAAVSVALVFASFAAVDVVRAGAWRDDLALWTRAVETSPTSWRSQLHLGAAEYRIGERLVLEADRLEVEDPLLAAFQERQGYELLDAAGGRYRAAHALYPRAFEVRLNLGLLHLLRGRILNRDAHPDDPPRRPGEFEEAVRWFTLAEESSPHSFRALYNRATALAEGGRVDEAIAEFERLAQDRSRTTMYAYPLADLYRRKGRTEDALAQLDLVESIEPGDAGIVALKRGEILAAAGRYEEAEQAYTRAKELLGMDHVGPPLYMARLIVAARDEKRFDMARVLWKAALDRGHHPGPKDRDLLETLR